MMTSQDKSTSTTPETLKLLPPTQNALFNLTERMDLMELLQLTMKQKKLINLSLQLYKTLTISIKKILLHFNINRAQLLLKLILYKEKTLKKEMNHSDSVYLTSNQKELS